MAAMRKPSSNQLTRTAALDCVPVKNSRVITRRMENGLVRITYPATQNTWFAKLANVFARKAPDRVFVRKLELDHLGTSVWHMIDARQSVQTIIRHFAAAQQLSSREAEVSVTQFLRELGRRGIIGMRQAP
ncbi:PqqD family peptide modification chaperone [Desulfosarcina ovata]|nr:PqqD family peptide modification chaperone [Desulfosarcina ovata]